MSLFPQISFILVDTPHQKKIRNFSKPPGYHKQDDGKEATFRSDKLGAVQLVLQREGAADDLGPEGEAVYLES